jgi:MFS family permease
MAYRFGVSASEIGLLLAVQAAALIGFQRKFGKLSDRYGRKYPIILGSLIGGATLILLGFSDSLLEFLCFMVVFGVSGGLSIPASSAAVADISNPRELGEAMGLFATSISIGMTLGPIVGGLLLDYLSIGSVFYMAAILSFIGAAVLLLMFKE